MPASQPDDLDASLAKEFRSSLRPDSLTEGTLAAAVEHTLRHPGSMVRARVCYVLSRDFGLSQTAALNLALSVELFHTASLLFDDLPCMDDADERRGVPCTHKKFGEAAAILGALAIINRAYSLLWKAMQEAPPEKRAEAAEFVERCLGMAGILNGQSHDLHFSAVSTTAAGVMRVAIGKTVSLIKLTLVLPAVLGAASPVERKLLSRLGVFWGLAYQMTDDLKDVLAATAETGKTTQRDQLLGRPNLALAEGPIRASKLLARLIALGDRALAESAPSGRVLESLTELRHKLSAQFSILPSPSVP